MLTEVKKIDALKRELKFQIPKDRVRLTMDEVYREIGKHAKVKGFRPGSVPRPILESEYKGPAVEETLNKLIPQVYWETITQEKFVPIDQPEISDIGFKDETITFTATLELFPEVTISGYKGIKIKSQTAQVTEEEIAKAMEFFKQGQGGSADAPLDDAVAKRLGYPNLEEFRGVLRRQLEVEKDRTKQMEIERQIEEDLLKNAKLIVPQSLVKKQLEQIIEESRAKWAEQRIPPEEIEKRIEESRDRWRERIERQLKISFILGRIAQLENLEIKKDEHAPTRIMGFLLQHADWN